MSTDSQVHPSNWLRVLSASGPIIPSLLSPFLTIPQYTPRQLIYDNDLWAFLFAIWATPTSFFGHLSRIIQAALLWLLPASTFQYYQLWLFVAVLRTCVGHLLTRSVGWALPQFFSHWALYEPFGGYGPSITIYLYIFGLPEILRDLFKRFHGVGGLAFAVCIGTLFCWLENAPWTYGVTVLGAGAVALGFWIFHMLIGQKIPYHPMLLDGQRPTHPFKLKSIIGTVLLALFIIPLPYGLQSRMAVFISTEMPSLPSSSSPFMEILVLSFPRPDVKASVDVLTSTIDSFFPYLSSSVVLSVFTHSTSHPAFEQVRDKFASTNVTFHVDADSHPDFRSGQYLHISEAFRWSAEKNSEWVMLVEDDFPLCGGDKGWDAVKKVMRILEESRSSNGNLRKQGGFVGTGGSGLIIHRSTLPVLILVMRAYAEIASKLPPTTVRRPPDVIMQDCLLGKDPLCPQRHEGSGLVITSRMIMDHIGGMVTTNPNKALNKDKWRCGWRHPFHGHHQVEVVAV